MSVSGIVFDVKHFSLHDGPGIRTTVFLKGCPLHCVWCHNPESIHPQIETLNGVPVGRDVGVDEIVDELMADQPFYESSGGGVTLSGGEPLMQPVFALALLDALGVAGIHRALDTCGDVPGGVIEQAARRADLILYDIKATDADSFRKWTSGRLDLILDTLRRINRVGTTVRLRCPLVPGINDDAEHLQRVGRLAEELDSVEAVDVMPYHRFGSGKFGFAVPGELVGVPVPDVAQVEKWILEIKKETGKPVGKG
jgi:pyruvate formate lyase activating enzyme